jgi:hypothetical protein
MLVGGVVRDVVQDHPDPSPMRLLKQPLKVRERERERERESPKEGIDARMIGDVIAEVGHWGGVEGGDPDRIHPEPLQMILSRLTIPLRSPTPSPLASMKLRG